MELDLVAQAVTAFMNTPSAWLAVILGAAGVSALTEILKKLSKLENDKVIMLLFMTVSTLATTIDYLLAATDLPPTILGFNTALIIGVATPLYRFVISPLSKLITGYQAYKQQMAAKVSEMEAINKTNSIDQPILSDVVASEIQSTVTTPVVVPAPKPEVVEQKPNIASF